MIRTDLDNVNGVESVVFSIPETGFEFTDNNGNFLLNARQGLDLDFGTHTVVITAYSDAADARYSSDDCWCHGCRCDEYF